jgi:uncharacterized protein (TIGR02147 family)
MTVYEYKDYKRYLSDLIETQRAQRGYQTKLAEAAGCQKAFISQVLRGTVHLTFDHGIGLCRFWQFTPDETEYFIELLQLARAGTPGLREHVGRRLEALRSRQSELSTKFKSTTVIKEEMQALYYSNPLYALIHVMTSIPEYQNIANIANRLKITSHQVAKVLSELQKMELVTKKRTGAWTPTERNLFLPKQSPFMHMHHSNWRVRALLDIQQERSEGIHYSTLHALSGTDAELFKQKILEFLKETKNLVEPSPEEEVVCFCLDYFKI